MMNAGLTCAELRPLLGGYVLEALEPHEAEAVRAHLPGCPVCAAELASLAELPHLLDLAAPVAQPDEPLSPGSEEALLDRFARESEHGQAAQAPPAAADRVRLDAPARGDRQRRARRRRGGRRDVGARRR